MPDQRSIDPLPATDDRLVGPPIVHSDREIDPVTSLPHIQHDESPFSRILGESGIALASRVASSHADATDPVHVVDAGNSDEYDPAGEAIRSAPPWLVSLIVHMVGMIVLGLLLVPQIPTSTLELLASFSDSEGVQLEEDLAVFSLDPTPMDESMIVDAALPPIEDPLMSPQQMDLSLTGTTASSNFESPNIGVALTGREPGMKNVLLMAYGGNKATEEAVKLGLEWLVRNQQASGLWSLGGPYADGIFSDDPTAATAMALLAFQGAGHTTKHGEHRETVEKGWRAMLKMQHSNGDFWRGSIGHYRLYAQAQATIAVCEIYAMTGDSRFREPAQRAVNYAVAIQDPRGGGWRYDPGSETDTSVTGWFVMGLQSARMAGLKVPDETWQRVAGYLDQAGSSDGSLYAYRPGEGTADHPMTAEGLLCRQYLGWPQSDRRLLSGIRFLNTLPMDWNDKNVYYWYYATQVYHHMGGLDWERWNRTMRELLPDKQTVEGAERGSWSPTGDRWGIQGGRLYTTCMCLFMLEVYYRHLPIYENVYE